MSVIDSLAGPSLRLRRLRYERKGVDQACANSPPRQMRSCRAPLGQRRFARSVTRARVRCQTSDKMELPPIRHAPRFLCASSNLAVIDRLELEFAPGLNVLTGETGAGKSILVGAVGLLVGGRASRRPGPDGRGHRRRPGGLRTPDGAGGHRPARDLVAGTQPRVRRRRARHERRAARARRRRWSICTASTSTRCCSIRRRISICSTSLPALARRARRRSPTRSRAWQQVRDRARPAARRRAAEASRAEFLAFQLAEIDRVAPQAGEDEELAGDAPGAGQRRPAAAALRRRLRRALRRRRRRRSPALGDRLEEGSASWPRSTRSFAPYLEAREAVKSQLEDLAFFLRSYAAGHRRLAGAAPGGRGPAGAARTSEEEARPVARGRDRARPASSGSELHDVEHATERAAELEAALGAARTRLPGARGGALDARRGGRRRVRARPRAVAGATSRWRGPAARSASRRAAAEAAVVRARASTRPSSTSRRIRARSCGRSRASRRAASCRGSCSR